jgi:3',5'-cyclic-AMP phosphodiesterase
VKFIHVSDLHLVPKGDKLWGLDPFARLEACLDDIAKFPP